jgi:SnoaL-like domain
MGPKELVEAWVAAFNRGNAEEMAGFYRDDAVNHQVVQEPVTGREAIRAMFEREFAQATMVCIVENIFVDGDWGILEWRDPLGLRGAVFFRSRTVRSRSSAAIGTGFRSSNCTICQHRDEAFLLTLRRVLERSRRR